MNNIMTVKRSTLEIKNLSSLMFLSILKISIKSFKPEEYANEWLQVHQSSESIKNMKDRSEDIFFYSHLFDLL